MLGRLAACVICVCLCRAIAGNKIRVESGLYKVSVFRQYARHVV